MLRPEEMTPGRIYEYQLAIDEWSEKAMFAPYEILEVEDYNKIHERLGAEFFHVIYDYSDLTTINIIKRIMYG